MKLKDPLQIRGKAGYLDALTPPGHSKYPSLQR